jgi:hypothetical protein
MAKRLKVDEGLLEELAGFKARLLIERDNLDQELIEQPQLYYEVSENLAQSVGRRDAKKNELKRLEAELFTYYMQELGKSAKPTQAKVEAAVGQDEDYQGLYGEYLDANREADLWLAMKEAYSQRSYVLKDLCSLHISGYFSNSSVQGKTVNAYSDKSYEEGRVAHAATARRVR